MKKPKKPMTVYAAQLFLRAFNEDDLGIWIEALKVSEEMESESCLGAAVERLKECWYHDGSRDNRRKVWEAAAGLKFEIQESSRLP
jgi:hypothetical protein